MATRTRGQSAPLSAPVRDGLAQRGRRFPHPFDTAHPFNTAAGTILIGLALTVVLVVVLRWLTG
jgi:hypothetical protein